MRYIDGTAVCRDVCYCVLVVVRMMGMKMSIHWTHPKFLLTLLSR